MKGSRPRRGGQGGIGSRVCSWGPRRDKVAKRSSSQGTSESPVLAPSHTQAPVPIPLYLAHPPALNPSAPLHLSLSP